MKNVIARGSIHHTLYEDIVSLFSSYFVNKECERAAKFKKKKVIDLIKNYYDIESILLFPYARSCLLAILESLELQKGSKILMTPYNIGPMVNIIEFLGFEPIFVDINLNDFGPDYKHLEEKISEKPSCFLITYLFGYVPDMEFICKLCNKYNVPLVEDISQNIGSKYKGKLLGKFGFASFCSTSLTKYVDGYNGAFVLINSKDFFKKVSKFTEKFNRPKRKRIQSIIFNTLIWNLALNRYIFNYLTYPILYFTKKFLRSFFDKLLGPSIKFEIDKNLPNYYYEDISNIQCSAMYKYFKDLDKLIEKRRSSARKVIKAFNHAKLKYNLEYDYEEILSKTYWQFLLNVTDTEYSRDLLFKNGIETGTTKLPNLSETYNVKLKNASRLKNNTIFLPLHDYLEEKDYFQIIKMLIDNGMIL